MCLVWPNSRDSSRYSGYEYNAGHDSAAPLGVLLALQSKEILGTPFLPSTIFAGALEFGTVPVGGEGRRTVPWNAFMS